MFVRQRGVSLRLPEAVGCDDWLVALTPGLRASDVSVTYRSQDGVVAETTLDRLSADDVMAGLPVREFRWYKGRRHYSGWY